MPSAVSSGPTPSPVVLSVVAAANTDETITSNLPTIDTSYSTSEDDRVLLINQSNATENGIWVVHEFSAWTRPDDFASGAQIPVGTLVHVERGTRYNNIFFSLIGGIGDVTTFTVDASSPTVEGIVDPFSWDRNDAGHTLATGGLVIPQGLQVIAGVTTGAADQGQIACDIVSTNTIDLGSNDTKMIRSFAGTITVANVTIVAVNAGGQDGRFIRSNGTNWVVSTPSLPTTAGIANKVLLSDGTNFVTSIPTFPNASASSGKIIRSDGTNWIASTPTFPTSAGVAGKILRSDGANYLDSLPTFPNAAGAAGKFIQSDGTNFVASTPTLPTTAGTNGNILVSDGTNWLSAARTLRGNSGSSTSNSNGTIVAVVTAGAGNCLINWQVVTDQTTAASTQTNINIVYSDGTFNTANSIPNQPVQIFANYAAILVSQSAQFSSLVPLQTTKKVTSINVTTQNTGTGTRGAIISAEEVPLS